MRLPEIRVLKFRGNPNQEENVGINPKWTVNVRIKAPRITNNYFIITSYAQYKTLKHAVDPLKSITHMITTEYAFVAACV